MSVQVNRLRWLRQGMKPAEVITAAVREVCDAEWWIVHVGGRKVSWCNPFTRRIVIGTGLERDDASYARLLVHELTHVRQMGSGWWRRLLFGALYLLSRRRRIAVEVEAKAHAQVARACMCRTAAIGDSVAAGTASAGALAGWRLPYLAGGDEDEIKAAVMERFRELRECDHG